MSSGSVIGLNTIRLCTTAFAPNGQRSRGGSDGDSPLSPATTTPPPSPCSRGKGCSFLETPTRKNKRKLSEPRKRKPDLGIKRHYRDSPGGSGMSESCCSDDGREDNDKEQRISYQLSNDQEDSLSRAPSELEDLPVSGSSNGFPHSVVPFPMVPGSLPSATCFLPGFYLAANPHALFPPPPFPSLPISLPHPGCTPVMEQQGRTHRSVNSNYYRKQALAGQVLSRQSDSPDLRDLSGEDDITSTSSAGRRARKNYKNMTRERRVEANARERTRVHTISAAFEALRRAVPSYSYNQKLSKLAILKIASTYIMALARLADVDCSHVSEPSIPVTFGDCVDLCTTTIQAEGRARRRH